jgi:hypothetical protein
VKVFSNDQHLETSELKSISKSFFENGVLSKRVEISHLHAGEESTKTRHAHDVPGAPGGCTTRAQIIALKANFITFSNVPTPQVFLNLVHVS